MFSFLAVTCFLFSPPQDVPEKIEPIIEEVVDEYGFFKINTNSKEHLLESILFCTRQMHECLNRSILHSDKILDVNLKTLMSGALKGAIGGAAGMSPTSICIGASLGSIAEVVDESYGHFYYSKLYLEQSYEYSLAVEFFEDLLWKQAGWEIIK